MFWANFLLASLTIGTALSADAFYRPGTELVFKRQEYIPNPTTCSGGGDTCESACGAGYIDCGDPSAGWCYNPGLAQPCCEPSSASPWVCNGGDFCLVDQYCCPGGIDPTECALSFGITLPATYVASTPTPNGSASLPVTTSAATDSVFTGSSTPSATSASVAVYTGAASANNAVGYTGILYSIVALILDLF